MIHHRDRPPYVPGPVRVRGDSPPFLSRSCVGLSVILVVLYFLLACFPSSNDSGEGSSRTIVINTIAIPFFWITLVAVPISFIVAISALTSKVRTGWLLLSLTLVGPFVGIFSIGNALTGHTDEISVKDSDGSEYHLLAQLFLQGSELVIGRLEHRSLFQERYLVVASSAWEEPLFMVRPEPAGESPKLYITPSHQVIAVQNENWAFLAYDSATGKEYNEHWDTDPKSPEGDIRDLSPFLLLREGDVPSQSDFQSLLDAGGKDKREGRPNIKAIEADLQNPNPEVRAMAQKLKKNLLAYPLVDN